MGGGKKGGKGKKAHSAKGGPGKQKGGGGKGKNNDSRTGKGSGKKGTPDTTGYRKAIGYFRQMAEQLAQQRQGSATGGLRASASGGDTGVGQSKQGAQ